MKKNSIFCIIPARGGSKSILNKNIKNLGGSPLISHTIETALNSNIFDKIIVTSDSEKILNISKQYKNITCIKRPKYLSTDVAQTEGALLHACKAIIKKEKIVPKVVFTLEPTSPFRSIETIQKCLKIYNSNNVDSIVAVAESDKCYGKIVNNKFLHNIKNQKRRRQDREKIFYESGTIYVTCYKSLLKYNSVLGKKIYPLVVSNIEAIDINNPIDFLLAEAIINKKITK